MEKEQQSTAGELVNEFVDRLIEMDITYDEALEIFGLCSSYLHGLRIVGSRGKKLADSIRR